MRKSPKILIVGSLDSIHLLLLMKNVKLIDPKIQLFALNMGELKFPEFKNYCVILNEKKIVPSVLLEIRFIRRFFFKLENYLLLKSIKQRFDLINVHFVTDFWILQDKKYKSLSDKLLLTPWGSDVLRINSKQKERLQHVYDEADYVSAMPGAFWDTVKLKFNVPNSKFVKLNHGSSMIDYIITHSNYTKDEAKHALGLSDKMIITCGYNGHEVQNHINIIKSIASVKEQLPQNLFLILPMTYGGTKRYRDKVKSFLDDNCLQYKIYDSFLGEEALFDLRKASDIFIHAQPTDGDSGSLQEYLLCGCKVINGKWTRYPKLETNGVPYCIFNSFDELGEKIVEVYFRKYKIIVPDETYNQIRTKAWSVVAQGWVDFYNSVVN